MNKDKTQFKKITTGNGFQNDLIATTNDRLEMTIETLQGVERTLNTNLLLLQQDIQDLNETITKANDKNDRLQKWFLFLAILAIFLTIAQIIDIFSR